MRVATSSVRVLKAAGGVILLWLLSAVVADAAPAARPLSYGSTCHAQTVSVQKLRRHVQSLGGPLKRLIRRHVHAALADTTPRVLYGKRAQLPGEEAAIQNDAPAARIDDDERPIPALEPIGLLHGSHDQQPRRRAFSPRSPRGPPQYA